MQPIEVANADSPAGIAPPPRPSAPWRVVDVRPLANMRLRVRFVDGTVGEVDLRSFLGSTEVQGTIFESLRSEEQFRHVQAELGAVVWPNGADLAPDAMYDAIRVSGRWVVQ